MSHPLKQTPDWLYTLLYEAKREIQEDVGRPLSGREVNDGYCRVFAKELVQRLDVSLREIEYTVWSYDGFEHTWVEIEGFHYDAECLDYPAQSPENLPFFSHPDSDYIPAKTEKGFPDKE